ncbi:hypothetical protein EYR40_009126 [Pleurotus pulmonarius]|nr:hypothetical protein EYR40_009126 [Pleurotus pulmonarius]
MAATTEADGSVLPSIRTPQSQVEFNLGVNEGEPLGYASGNGAIVLTILMLALARPVLEFATHHLDAYHVRAGSMAAAHLGDDDGRGSRARRPMHRAGPVFVQPSSGYLSQVVDTLRACGILPEAAADDIYDDNDTEEADNGDVDEEEDGEEEAGEDDEEEDDDDDDDDEEGVQRWNVWDESKESWGEIPVISKPSHCVVKKGRLVERALRAEGEQVAAPPIAVSTIGANGKEKEKAVAENTPAVGGDSSTATTSRGIGEELPVAEGEEGETEERHKAKASKHTSEGNISTVRAAQREHSIGTRRRKETVNATIRAKVAQTKAARGKPTARGKGVAKATSTGNALATGRASPVLPPPKRTSEVKISTVERPPLSLTAAHNTPSRSSKEDEGCESVSSGPSLTIELLATTGKGIERVDEATDADAKEDPSVATNESAEKADEKATRRSTRNAEKLQAPKAKEAKAKAGAGRPKRKEMHEDGREEKDKNKRARKDDVTPAEEDPKAKIMVLVQKGITQKDIVNVKAELKEMIPEAIIANGGPKLRRSARSRKATFKTRHQ